MTASMVICGTDELQHRYRGRIEKVKFGVPIAEAFSHDIPATLLVLLLKVNKEGPLKKDILRAPGNQSQVRKLSQIMQNGRLVNISRITVYTAASVIKRFLSKLPGGIFGPDNEQQLFAIVQHADAEQQRQVFCRVTCSLPMPSQHLLVLLFGTFRIIADSAETFNTRMGPDAIGISVAPSLFHTCIHDGQRAKLEDVMRFKMASQVIAKIITNFGYSNLFPRSCYEFYARITGRTLRIDDSWQFTFQYPSRALSQPSICFGGDEAATTTSGGDAAAPLTLGNDDQQVVADDDGERAGPSGWRPARSDARKSHTSGTSTIGRRHSSAIHDIATDGDDEEDAEDDDDEAALESDVYSEALPAPKPRAYRRRSRGRAASHGQPPSIGAYGPLLAEQRLTASLGECLGLHEARDDRGGGSSQSQSAASRGLKYESTRSLVYLERVHDKQTRRMRTRSEWFLSPSTPHINRDSHDDDDDESCDDGDHCGPSSCRSYEFERDLASLAPPSAHGIIVSSAASSPARHLTLPSGSDAEMAATSDSEAASSTSAASSAKEQRPTLDQEAAAIEGGGFVTRKTIVAPLAALAGATSPIADVGETTPRLPFQLLQHHSGESDDAPLSATPPARLQPPVFFADEEEPPAKASKSSSSSAGAGSQKSVIVAPTATAAIGLSRVSSIGVVRRKSWRTHYVRPNKSLDTAEPPTDAETTGGTSKSTPMCGPTRRGSTTTPTPAAHSDTRIAGDSAVAAAAVNEGASRLLVRRRSSGSTAAPMAASTSKPKAPVGVRHSTHT